MADETFSGQLQSYLDLLRAGDSTVYAAFWDLVNERLTVLTRKMKRGQYQRVGSWEQTEDIAQNARVRLVRALKQKIPETPREFYGLANLQIRRELLDTIRANTGRNGNRKQLVGLSDDVLLRDETFDTNHLAMWREFHEFVEAMPDHEREIVELLWYQGLTQDQAAEVLGVDKSTVKRRWREIRTNLASVLPKDEQSAE